MLELTRNSFCMRMGVARLRVLPPAMQLAFVMQRLPRDTALSPLMHEIVHHASANTAVNVAMQCRWLQLMRRTLSSPGFGVLRTAQDEELAIGIARAEAVLQPFAEGLAVFAESDCAVPSSDDYASVRDLRLGITDCIELRLLACTSDVDDRLDTMARAERAERLAAGTIDRKTTILSNPFWPESGNDCYLVGYLAVKALWNRFVVQSGPRHRRLRASSFLHFLLYYFYEDWVLARLIVDGAAPSGAQMVQRLIARYTALLDSDVPDRVLSFIDDVDGRARRGLLQRGPEELAHGGFKGLDQRDQEIREGMAELRAFERRTIGPLAPLSGGSLATGLRNLTHDLVVQPLPSSLEVEAFRARVGAGPADIRVLDFVLDLPQQRRALCLLVDLAVDCRPAGPDTVLLAIPGELGGAQRLAGAKTDRLPPGGQRGQLYAVMMSTDCPWRLYCMVIAGGTVLAVWSHGMEDVQELHRIHETLALQQQIESATPIRFEELTTLYGTVLASEECGTAATEATVLTCRALQNAMRPWHGLFAAKSATDYGFRSSLSSGQVRTLAAIGLCNSFTTRRDKVESLVSQGGHDVPGLLSAAQAFAVRTGVRLLEANGDSLRATV
jgi:hypothetical protein